MFYAIPTSWYNILLTVTFLYIGKVQDMTVSVGWVKVCLKDRLGWTLVDYLMTCKIPHPSKVKYLFYCKWNKFYFMTIVCSCFNLKVVFLLINDFDINMQLFYLFYIIMWPSVWLPLKESPRSPFLPSVFVTHNIFCCCSLLCSFKGLGPSFKIFLFCIVGCFAVVLHWLLVARTSL